MISLICPVSPYRVNETAARIVATTMLAMIILFASTGLLWVAVLIALDYFIRGFTALRFSPASWLAYQISDQFYLSGKLIDKAPKIFAARVGFLLTLLAVLLYVISPTASLVVMFVLMFFATLESVFNYCVGCVMFTLVVFPILGKSSPFSS